MNLCVFVLKARKKEARKNKNKKKKGKRTRLSERAAFFDS